MGGNQQRKRKGQQKRKVKEKQHRKEAIIQNHHENDGDRDPYQTKGLTFSILNYGRLSNSEALTSCHVCLSNKVNPPTSLDSTSADVAKNIFYGLEPSQENLEKNL